MNRTELLSSIHHLQLSKERLLQELEILDLDLKSQQAQYSRLLNDDTIVYRLPSELLSGIFMMCTTTRRAFTRTSLYTLPFQVVASHVSHHWREIALGTPLLWNTPTFTVRPSSHINGRIISQLEAHLERSGSCFLDISLDFQFSEELGDYCRLLAKHSRRWRRLSILSMLEEGSEIHEMLRNAEVPILEHLSLTLGRSSGRFRPRQELSSVIPSILPRPPCLSFVRLAGYALGNLHPPTSSVTTLHLDGWAQYYLSHDQFKIILEGSPSLINLSLNQLCLYHSRDPFAITKPTTLPSLRALRIRGPCSPISQLMSLLNSPQLDSITLGSIEFFDSQVMPTVRSLVLDDCEAIGQEIGKLVHSLPSLSELSIDETLPEIFLLVSPIDSEGKTTTKQMPWPQLQTITIHDLQSKDVADFCSMVSLRQAGGCSLRQINLNRKSRKVLQKQQRLEWLREKVIVENAVIDAPWPNGLQYEDVNDLLQ